MTMYRVNIKRRMDPTTGDEIIDIDVSEAFRVTLRLNETERLQLIELLCGARKDEWFRSTGIFGRTISTPRKTTLLDEKAIGMMPVK